MPPFFDPLLAKAIVWRPSRDEAIAGLAQALAETRLYGVETNRQYLQQILSFAPFTAGEPRTRCLEQLRYRADTVEVLSAGTQTSVQTTRDVWGTGRWVYRPRDRWMTGRCAGQPSAGQCRGRRCAGDHP